MTTSRGIITTTIVTLAIMTTGAAQASATTWRWSANLSPGQTSSVLSFWPSVVACAPLGTYNYYAYYITSYGRRWYNGSAPRADYYSASRGFKNVGTVGITCYAT